MNQSQQQQQQHQIAFSKADHVEFHQKFLALSTCFESDVMQTCL